MHGTQALAIAERATAVLFGGRCRRTAEDILRCSRRAVGDRGRVRRGDAARRAHGDVGLATSKGEAARLIKQGGFYVNDARVTDERGRVTLEDAVDGAVIVLRKGQRERRIVQASV